MHITANKNGYLICTMPRSGTWYSHYFFTIYDALLKNEEGIALPLRNFMPHDGLGINLGIFHSICPGFLQNYIGDQKEDWNAIDFATQGYNWGHSLINANPDLFFPSSNPNVRIVYLYRNPLDQCVSYFRHAKKHASPDL